MTNDNQHGILTLLIVSKHSSVCMCTFFLHPFGSGHPPGWQSAGHKWQQKGSFLETAQNTPHITFLKDLKNSPHLISNFPVPINSKSIPKRGGGLITYGTAPHIAASSSSPPPLPPPTGGSRRHVSSPHSDSCASPETGRGRKGGGGRETGRGGDRLGLEAG